MAVHCSSALSLVLRPSKCKALQCASRHGGPSSQQGLPGPGEGESRNSWEHEVSHPFPLHAGPLSVSPARPHSCLFHGPLGGFPPLLF